MSDKAARAERKIERLAQAVGCSQDGIDWMECYLDPFPDENRKIAGYPDQISTPSVTQTFKQTVTVKRPSGIPDDATWDANVIFDGLFDTNRCYNYPELGTSGVFVNNPFGDVKFMGGITVRTGNEGVNLDMGYTNEYITPITGGSLVPYRVISTGMEIINRTATNFKQGTLIAWNAPNMDTTEGNAVMLSGTGSSGQIVGAFKSHQVKGIPLNADQALILSGSLAWEAESGAYIRGSLSDSNIPVRARLHSNSCFAYQAGNTGQTFATQLDGVEDTNMVVPDSSDSRTAFNAHGIYLRGLSPTTAFDVVWHYTLERFPNSNDVDLITMATKSPAYDPKVLELVSRTNWKLPVACKLDENSLGDFIMDCANALQTWGVPGMGIVKQGLEIANRLSYDRNPQAQPRELIAKNTTVTKAVSSTQPKVPKLTKKMPPLPPIPQTKIKKN